MEEIGMTKLTCFIFGGLIGGFIGAAGLLYLVLKGIISVEEVDYCLHAWRPLMGGRYCENCDKIENICQMSEDWEPCDNGKKE